MKHSGERHTLRSNIDGHCDRILPFTDFVTVDLGVFGRRVIIAINCVPLRHYNKNRSYSASFAPH